MPGRDFRVVLAVCQKIPSRPPFKVVTTNCERLSRERSRTRSIATPRRTHERTGIASTTSASSGHSPRWQYTFPVRGQVSFAFSTIGVDPTGTHKTYGKVEP